MPYCIHPNCKKNASFNYINEKKRLYCKEHKLENMVSLTNKSCCFTGCRVTPNFNYADKDTGIYCTTHKLEGMVDVKHKHCEHKDCKTRPTYNFADKDIAIYCTAHKLEGMIDMNHKTCEFKDCKLRPTYNFVDKKDAILCEKHKQEGMVNVISKTCEFEGCKTLPIFNYIDKTGGRYCASHKLEGMVNVKDKTCIHDGCTTLSTFNFKDEKNPTHCSKHKLEGMVDIKNKKCIFEGCDTLPIFNFTDEKERLYCATHRLIGMIDITHKTCMFEGCTIQPSYNFPNQVSLFCKTHAKDGMIINPTKKCKNCNELGIYGITLLGDRRCETHKQIDDKNLLEKRCICCNLDYVLNIDKLCQNCDAFNKKTFKLIKQERIKHLLESNGIKIEIYDKSIDTICTKKRPDFVIQGLYRTIVIEVDEFQHIRYTDDCECKRMVDIYQSVGENTTFIRYNPDSFTINGIKQDISQQEKEEKLLSWINTLKKRETTIPLSVVYLFYDEYDKNNNFEENLNINKIV